MTQAVGAGAPASARAFIEKWGPGGPAYGLSERAGAQAHFIDLCRLLDVPEPGDPDNYCFEKGLVRTGAGQGFADVWMRGCFAWEYKGPGAALDAALRQLMQYALPLHNPPLLVVSDRLRIEVHTHFTGTPSDRHVFRLEDFTDPAVRQRLRWIFTDPERFKPAKTNRQITEEAASTFAGTAARMRDAGEPAAKVSHFLTQCLFCFFAEDVGLLPDRLFERLVGISVSPERLRSQLENLFQAMREGGLFGVNDVPWFNGGLFATIDVPELAAADVTALRAASALNWSSIDPSIFGTLFERGMDPEKRSQLGAHYTDPATIDRLINPVVRQPLMHEWEGVKETIVAALARRDGLRAEAQAIPSTTPALRSKFSRLRSRANEAEREAQDAFRGFLDRLKNYRVLDPACGSGNFLYLALKSLKDLEHQANLEAEQLGLERQYDLTGPHNTLGLEINGYAAELARVTVWIGELQWRIQRGYGFRMNPVLQPLDHIEHRDALMGPDGLEAGWPAADVVVGNPPFVGDKRMRGELGDEYTEKLRALYEGRVPGGADLVCYWFEIARAKIEAGELQRAGLVSTNSIRQGANREVLHRVLGTTRIFEAWGDQEWVNNGAAVRVSLTCFGTSEQGAMLDGEPVHEIHADLRATTSDEAADFTSAVPLAENANASFFGFCLAGPFVVDSATARRWLRQPNPNGRSNAEVVKPIWNGADITRRPADRWAIDFGVDMTEAQASQFEAPFEHANAVIRVAREGNREASRVRNWWRHGRPRPDLRRAGAGLSRWIVTSETAKHRYFVWLPTSVAPEHKLVVIPRADDTTFGLLSSRIHVLWALRNGSTLEDRPVYTTGVCFAPFPFPEGLTPADTAHQRMETLASGACIPAGLPADVRRHAQAIAEAAYALNTLRQNWLNPPDWVTLEPDVVPLGMATSPYPDRISPRAGFEAEVKKRTLTNLYNAFPAWLARAHAALDAAVAAAYGWTEPFDSLSADQVLGRLLALNHARASVQGAPAAAGDLQEEASE